jgi:hypothetical protein
VETITRNVATPFPGGVGGEEECTANLANLEDEA